MYHFFLIFIDENKSLGGQGDCNSFYASVRGKCVLVNGSNVCHIWEWQSPAWPLLAPLCLLPLTRLLLKGPQQLDPSTRAEQSHERVKASYLKVAQKPERGK